MGACILCHSSHSSWKPKLVVDEGNKICAGCHEDRIRRDRESRHVHPPVTENCDRCHDPHGSDWPAQLLEEPRKLCVTCHEDIERQMTHSKIVHGAMDEKQQCANCHNGHSSSLPTLLKGSLLDTCLSCHNEEIPLPDGRKVANMAALLKENPNHHGPIRQGDCSACHNPHASSHFDLLVEAYPERFYAAYDPNDYKLCFTCHRSELVSSEDGRGVTQFRNGSLNLHYVHVSKPSRGRTCRACHAVHASKQYAHISESVPYGAWQYRINFQSNPQGGKCGPACHVERSYDWTKGSSRTEMSDDSKPTERVVSNGYDLKKQENRGVRHAQQNNPHPMSYVVRFHAHRGTDHADSRGPATEAVRQGA
jgi:predicted CXXCH cytochrome family protein